MVAYLDDMRDWPFTVKLAAQVGRALARRQRAVVSRCTCRWLGTVALGWLGVPVTLAWILFATNAMNFIDGLNGLAARACRLACAVWPASRRRRAAGSCTSPACCWLAGLLGFLPFNFPRARIFMGDVGSQFCGFVLAVLGVAAARFGEVELSVLLVPMLLFGRAVRRRLHPGAPRAGGRPA